MKISISKNTLINIFYLSFIVILIGTFIRSIVVVEWAKESLNISEFLINYQGGFVRRGLLGEILLFLTKNFGLDTYTMIYQFLR